jgi:hypothetical protein
VRELLSATDDRFVNACVEGGVSLGDLEEEYDETLAEARADPNDAKRQLERMRQRYLQVYNRAPVIANPQAIVQESSAAAPALRIIRTEESAVPRSLTAAGEATLAKLPDADANADAPDEVPDVAALLEAEAPALNAEQTIRRMLQDPRLLLTERSARTAQRIEVPTFEAHGARYTSSRARSLDAWQQELQHYSPEPPTLGMLSTGFACVTMRLGDALFVCCVLQACATEKTLLLYKFIGFLFYQSRRSHLLDLTAGPTIAVHQPEIGAYSSSSTSSKPAADH